MLGRVGPEASNSLHEWPADRGVSECAATADLQGRNCRLGRCDVRSRVVLNMRRHGEELALGESLDVRPSEVPRRVMRMPVIKRIRTTAAIALAFTLICLGG